MRRRLRGGHSLNDLGQAEVPTGPVAIGTARGVALTFQVPESEADERAAVEAPPERPRDSPD